MPNAEKLEKVAALRERIQGSGALLLAEYRGLSVHDATELRRSLSGQARFAVVKNTLMQRAAVDAGLDELQALLEGPTAVAFVEGDVVATAKKVVEAARRFPSLVLKGGYLDGKVLSAAEAQALATLESREVMLSKVAGMLKSEMSRAASLFQTIQGRFLSVLEAYRAKLPGEEAAEAPAGESPAEPAVEAATERPPAEATAVDAAQSDSEAEAPAESGSEAEVAAESASEAEPAGDERGEAAPEAERSGAEAPEGEETTEARPSAKDEEE
jgi:large subunit ribosomal protein L10